MRLGQLAAKNVLRNKLRTSLTIFGVAVAIIAFVLLRTVLTAWSAAADYAAKDRIATRHKVSFIMPLPITYVEKLRASKDKLGIKDVTWMSWFGGKHPQRESDFFATIAVDPDSFLTVYDEISIPPEQVDSWKANRRGAVIGEVLAKKFGWEVGDKITLTGTIYPGDWDFEISGIYTATRRSVDRSSFWFHWDYLNETADARFKDKIGWIVSRVDDPSKTAGVSKKVDAMFDEYGDQTLTMSERAMNASFIGMISAILTAIDIVSIVILAIMVLILGNTIAMGVRERTNEYGMLRALGFMPRHIAMFVVGEAMTIGALGGTVGLLLAYPLVNQGIGRFLEENMGGFFPYFRVAASTAILAVGLAIVLGIIAALIPAIRAAKLNVVDSIRRVA